MSNFACGLLTAATLMAFCDGAAAVPAVSVKPAVGPPTTSTIVGLTGFPPSSAIDVYFDTTDVCLTFTDGTGAGSCTVSVPRAAQPQTHWISALVRGTATGNQKTFLVRTDMAQFHGRTAAHQGVNPYENTIDEGNVGSLGLLWRQPIGTGGTLGAAVVSNGIVYVGGHDGKLYAFNGRNGATIAGFPVVVGGPPITDSTPAVGGGRVFVGGDNLSLNAYNAATGAAVSGFPVSLPAAVQSTPSLALGNVYVGCTNGQVFAFNATTGVAVPGFPVSTGGVIFASPTVYDGQLFVGSNDHKIYGFDALSGATLPGFPISTLNVVNSTVAAAGGLLFVGSADTNLYGIDTAGNLLIASTTSGVIQSSPAVAAGKVIVASRDNKLYAFDTRAGAVVWSTPIGLQPNGSPMVANGVVYVSDSKELHALSLSTGQVLWNGAGRSLDFNSPVVADGIVFFAEFATGTNIGRISAYSINGDLPSSHLPGGYLGVQPALSALIPDMSMKRDVQRPD